jgi:HlyD family secretion protein
MKKWLRRGVSMLIVGVLIAAIVYGLWPQPVEVDVGVVSRGPMQVTVNEEGKTRVREVYEIDAPLSGSLHRVRLKAGNKVAAGQTVLAVVEPADPEFLDATERNQAEIQVKVAEASQQEAKARIAVVQKEHELAAANLVRARDSYAKSVASIEQLNAAEIREQVWAEQVRSAQSAERVAMFQVELAKAALQRTRRKSALPAEEGRLEILAPIDGVVLKVVRESAGIINTGAPILTIGDPRDLEMVIDVLSSDAVKIAPGDRVIVERWGGEAPLAGRVRLVEPAAELKISALGVEEQRVNVIADFTDPAERRAGLGHAYRVEARIVVWETADAVKVPAGARFRDANGEWAVFTIRDGVARLTPVKLGQSNGLEVEVLDGLTPGEVIVLHPSDRVKDGVKVVPR